MKDFLARAKSKWLALPLSNKLALLAVGAWALTWACLGTLAAFSFGVGASAGFFTGMAAKAEE